MEYELTILMPCLNEAETIATCIRKAKQFLTAEKIHGEILVVDNGSTDESKKIAEAHGAKVIQVTKTGYGAALKAGITAAQGRYIVMGDADDSYSFFDLQPFLAKLREGYDLVMGNRFKGGIAKGAMPFLNRYVGNPILSLLGRIFFKSNVGDFHCGLRGFRRDSFLNLNLHGDGMEFASEMVIKATLRQLKITEVPTTLAPDGRSRPPHLRPWRDGWRHLRLLLLFSPRWLFLYPGLFLFVMLIILSPSMAWTVALMMMGFQLISFFIFAHFLSGVPVGKNKYYSVFTLERGIMISFIFIVTGCLGTVCCSHYFSILVLTGAQFLFSSFFLGFLKLFPDG